MALPFLTNILQKAQRAKNKVSFTRKSKREHNLAQKQARYNAESEKGVGIGLLPKINLSLKWAFTIIFILAAAWALYYSYQVVKVWIGFTPRTYQAFSQTATLNPDNTPAATYIWKGNSKLTVALVGTDKVDSEHTFIDALGIYSLDPLANTFTVFMINPDLKIYVSSLGKEVNFRTMLNDKTLSGDRMTILKNAVSALLAVKVDRYLLVDKSSVGELTQEMNPVKVDIAQDLRDPDTAKLPARNYVTWNKGSQQVILGSNFLEFMASDNNGRDDQLHRQQDLLAAIPFYQSSLRSYFDLPNLINAISKDVYTDMSKDEIWLAVTKTLAINVNSVKKGYTKAASYSRVAAVSFYPVFVPDLNLIDADINNIFFDINIFKEQGQIEVLNGSSVKGLANSRARWINNLGARIIRIGNSFEHADVTRIYCANPGKYPYTLAELSRIFNQKAVLVEQDYPNRHVGDIVIELGDVFE